MLYTLGSGRANGARRCRRGRCMIRLSGVCLERRIGTGVGRAVLRLGLQPGVIVRIDRVRGRRRRRRCYGLRPALIDLAVARSAAGAAAAALQVRRPDIGIVFGD